MENLDFINRIEDGSATTQPSSKHLTKEGSQMSTPIYWDVQSLNDLFNLPHTITQIEIFEEELDTKYVDSGELAPFYGKQHTEETKQKISNSLKGRTDIIRTKPSNWIGKHHSEESKNKMAESHKIYTSINQYDLNNNFIKEFNSIVLASKEINTSISNIRGVLTNKRKTAAGFIWKYLE